MASGIGSMRDRYAFLAPFLKKDGAGNTTNGYIEKFKVAGEGIDLTGGETVTEARLSSRQPVTLRVRQSSDTRQVTTGWRVRDARKNVTYNIRSIARDRYKPTMYFNMMLEAGTLG